MTEPEIRAGLTRVTEANFISTRARPPDLFTTGLAAAQALARLRGETAVELILLGLTSYSDSIRQVATQAIGAQSPEVILAFLDYLLTGTPHRLSRPPPPGINLLEESVTSIAVDLLIKNMHLRGSEVIFDRALSSTRSSFLLNKIAKASESCFGLGCREIINRNWRKAEPFVAGQLLKGLANLPDSKELFEIINEAQGSTSHPIRYGAIYAAVGMRNPAYLPMLLSATTALLDTTRMLAFSGLKFFDSQQVWSKYRQGLSDSTKDVRFFVMSELSRRSEPEARELLLLVAENAGVLKIRTDDQQWRLAGIREKTAERLRTVNPFTGLNSDDPSLGRMTMDVARWSRQRLYQEWNSKGFTDSDIARRLLREMGYASQALPASNREDRSCQELLFGLPKRAFSYSREPIAEAGSFTEH